MNQRLESKLWAINNVHDKAKDKAKKLARENRQRIGEWLTDLILNASENNNFIEEFPTKIMVETLNHINLRLIELREEIEIVKRNQIPVKRSFWNKF